jgi:N-carbamoylputrescine amidase
VGEILARAGGDREEVVTAKCNLQKIDETRLSWPVLRDRRIDAYASLQARFLDACGDA